MKKERPILFSGPMVRATLREIDPKTHTRRVVKPQPLVPAGILPQAHNLDGGKFGFFSEDADYCCPYGAPGDRLWVRETFGFVGGVFDENENPAPWIPDRPAIEINELKLGRGYYTGHAIYAADGYFEWNAGDDPSIETRSAWHPSIHMPRSISRILLEIVSVRVERLQDISEADAIAEGVERHHKRPEFFKAYNCKEGIATTARASFETLWHELNGPESWDANPYVWVVEFKKI